MALSEDFVGWVRGTLSNSKLLPSIAALTIAYYMAVVVYRLTFHPLSRYPGLRVAAVTDLWWAYARTTGRYPWIIEDALKQHDIYLAQDKNLELFVQVGYDALDTGDGGISGETGPVRHRAIAKKLAPAFSMRNPKAREATILKHVDLFIQRMREVGVRGNGVELQRWSDWLALDLSADMTYGRDMGQVRDMKGSVLLSATLKLNLFITMSEVTRKFRLLSPLMYLTIPPSVWLLMPKLIRMNTEDVKTRIERRGQTDRLDYFEQLIPAHQPVPQDRKHIYHLENVAGQLLLASWQPLADQFYSLIFFLLGSPDAYATLVDEVRTAFATSDSMNTESTATLKYLQACQRESLRLHKATVDGLPRVSPGAVLDGKYIPKEVGYFIAPVYLSALEEFIYNISYFAAARSRRYFTDPLSFRPERWLSPDHPRFDPTFKGDNLVASKPFSQGPRGCPGGPIAMAVVRLFIAKFLWHIDLEAAPGFGDLSFEKDFKWLTFWERPPFWVRLKATRTAAMA
ncbi:cytochrome P450 [Apiospora aurea]|uniref:Cytochrome P450 n=1 Tax=Apiospora aurea TaxID=335848 RepID=A0ABR1Q5L2_9PEZI